MIDGGKVDLCSIDPGYEVDLYVRGSLRSMTAVWMGLVDRAEGDRRRPDRAHRRQDLAQSMQQWLGLSPFAKEKKRVAA